MKLFSANGIRLIRKKGLASVRRAATFGSGYLKGISARFSVQWDQKMLVKSRAWEQSLVINRNYGMSLEQQASLQV